jgi:oxygen-independent coproporphyrinogen-3 oxidase
MLSASLSPPASPDAKPAARSEPFRPEDLSIYVHWPFCRSKCPYCDFNSHVAGNVEAERWRAALLRDLAAWAEATAGRRVASLFFGGGTPSLMPVATAAAVIDQVVATWSPTADFEISLEANPTSAESTRFRGYRLAGVGRLSLGVQALDDRALAFLGRQHSAGEAKEAIARGAAIFPRFSFDLIAARPGQTPAAWRAELAEASRLAGDHLSVYQLTIEPGTVFHRQGMAAMDEDTAAALYEATAEVLAAAGLPAYEISNHARRADACRHNLRVWRGGDYLGIGPGAHGRLTVAGATVAQRQIRSPQQWLATVEAVGSGLAKRFTLTSTERREELLLMGFRLTEGIDRRRFQALAGADPFDVVDAAGLDRLVEGGYLDADSDIVRATPAGRLCLDSVLATLLAG